MKKTLCLFLSLLFLLPTFTGCNDGSFSSLPENSPSFSPSIGQDGGESRPSSPSFAPLPSEGGEADPSFSELPLPIDEIYFDIFYGGSEGSSCFDYPTQIFVIPAYCSFPDAVLRGEQVAIFKFYIDTKSRAERTAGVEGEKERIRRLDAIAEGLRAEELTEKEQWDFRDCFDQQGEPILSVIEARKARARYAMDLHTVALEHGEQGLWQQVKADWMARCEAAGITTVDVGKDYLYIFCTGPQLISLAKNEEHYSLLYTVNTVSLKKYSDDRVNIVN